MIEIVDSGVVYRNPLPHLRALHAWHPSLVQLGARQWLASFDLAEAVESHGYATYLSRSDDDGESWSAPVRVIDPAAHAGSCSLRLGKVGDGTLTLAGALHWIAAAALCAQVCSRWGPLPTATPGHVGGSGGGRDGGESLP